MSNEVAIVMPAYNAEHLLERSLGAALVAAGGAEVLVVDPGSTDATGEVARALGASVHRLAERAGPAEARNAGVERIDAEIVLFIDADCVARPDVVERVVRAFREDQNLVALSGSYDDDPPERNLASSYMNLRHHFTHQTAGGGESFWAGCGAVRRKAFREVGGFDAERFPRPQIEDLELGVRLSPHGAVRIDPTIQVTHLKRWTLFSVVDTDIRSRAIPWTRLILETGEVPRNLNLRWSQRVAAALAPLALLALPISAWAAWTGAWIVLALCGASLAASWALNAPMLRFFRARRGLPTAIGAWALHQLHLSYSAVVFAALFLRARLGATRN